MRTHIKIALVFVFIFCFCLSNAQEKVYVITKTITKEYQLGDKLLILNGEKANIEVNNWEKDDVKIEIKLISKSYNKKSAERDLSAMKYSIVSNKNSLKISNSFYSEKLSKIYSNLSVEYLIYVPQSTHIKFVNIYGDINLNNILLNGSISNSFGVLTIENSNASLSVDLNYSELQIHNTKGDFNIKSKSSNLLFSQISGKYILNTVYGDIDLKSVKTNTDINVEAQRTVVNLSLSDLSMYKLKLITKRDEIIVPEEYENRIIKEAGLSIFNNASTSGINDISINTTYCPITINIK